MKSVGTQLLSFELLLEYWVTRNVSDFDRKGLGVRQMISYKCWRVYRFSRTTMYPVLNSRARGHQRTMASPTFIGCSTRQSDSFDRSSVVSTSRSLTSFSLRGRLRCEDKSQLAFVRALSSSPSASFPNFASRLYAFPLTRSLAERRIHHFDV